LPGVAPGVATGLGINASVADAPGPGTLDAAVAPALG
jgi:hypothetical protein